MDVAALENEVFSHLYNFFRRYYSEGDFISLRRYKEGVYAIPYEGEEVKLHWANADQYYVKSSETFGTTSSRCNRASGSGFISWPPPPSRTTTKPPPARNAGLFCAKTSHCEENGELFIRFEYRPLDDHAEEESEDNQAEEGPKQAIHRSAIDAILKTPGFEEWAQALGKPAPSDKQSQTDSSGKAPLRSTPLETRSTTSFTKIWAASSGGNSTSTSRTKSCTWTTSRHESAPKVEQYLSQIKVIRIIAHKIIHFLDQLEGFQKKLWLKKKFVIETNYCITLDRVPEELYPEIVKNDTQRDEWVRLFAIDTIKKNDSQPGFSTPLTVAFLKHNPHLVVDTGLFPARFRERLLASFDDLDQNCDGILAHADNFQALLLLQNRFHQTFKSFYIDPPYNTGSMPSCIRTATSTHLGAL